MDGRPAHCAEDHFDLLRPAFDDGAAAHGALPFSFDVFSRRALALTVRRLERSMPSPSREEIADALSRAALADLYLAVACEDGVPGAWERFAERYERTIVALAVRRGASNADAEELASELPGELFTPPPDGGSRTRLGTFDGAGSLQGWLAVIVQRRLADRRRVAVRVVPLPDGHDALPAREGAGSGDPVGLAVGAEMGRRFDEALRDAWTALTPREALVILLRYRDGVPQNEIARMLGIGEPRVSRTLSGAAAKIRDGVVRRVGHEPGLGERDAEHTWAAIERSVAEFMATLPHPSDSSQKS